MYTQAHIARNRHPYRYFSKECYSSGMAGGWRLSRCLIRRGFTWRPGQVWHGYSLSLTFHYDLISHSLLQLVGFAQRILVLICGMTAWRSQESALSQAKTPALTEPGWHAGQQAYRMKRRCGGNMKKIHFRGRKQGLSKHIDWFHRSARWN